ncbi:MAG TPA: 50S ribosomal protein L29 [Planctomycetaceae bacterium]|nr:50S ribosomal protein L29 [Planctomycetaceae bacterium]|tara:strand:+ start:1497 stop:1787 length:291 start_codon:yes stop_codon:yes gene_type:complete
MTKASEYRQMSDEQLTHELRQLIEELFRLTVQAATERLDAPSNLRKIRRDIARVKTIQRERELSGEGEVVEDVAEVTEEAAEVAEEAVAETAADES